MKTIIILGGNPPSKELLEQEMENNSIIICADSGANCLYKHKIIPNYLLGDFDSIDKRVLEFYENSSCIIERYPADKDYTDGELALIKAKEIGSSEICFLGYSGNRLDHFFGNIGLLYKTLSMNVRAYLKDDKNMIMFLNKSNSLRRKECKTFSLQAYCDVVKNLNIQGAKYNLKNYDLHIGDSLTISNEFIDDEAKISFDSGNLLVFYSED